MRAYEVEQISLISNSLRKIFVKWLTWIWTVLWIADARISHCRKRFCMHIVLFSVSSIIQPSDIIRLRRIVVKSPVAIRNLKVFLVCWSFTVVRGGIEQQNNSLPFRKKLKRIFFNWSHFIIMPYHVIFLALQKAQCLTFWNVSIAFLKDFFLNIQSSGR